MDVNTISLHLRDDPKSKPNFVLSGHAASAALSIVSEDRLATDSAIQLELGRLALQASVNQNVFAQ
jgi:hypothetical protein